MRLTVTAVVALALAGCADTPRVSFADHGRYAESHARYAARNGQMPLVVVGNPTTAPNDALAETVADALRGTHPDRSVVFVPVTSDGASGFRTVVAFGGADVNTICGMTEAPSAPTTSAAAAAFCSDDRMFSFARGVMPAVAGVDDPNLRGMIQALGLSIFPPSDRLRRGSCIGLLC